MKKWLNKIELEGKLVKLIPMQAEHKPALVKAATDGALWKLWYTSVPSEETIDSYVDSKLKGYKEDVFCPLL